MRTAKSATNAHLNPTRGFISYIVHTRTIKQSAAVIYHATSSIYNLIYNRMIFALYT